MGRRPRVAGVEIVEQRQPVLARGALHDIQHRPVRARPLDAQLPAHAVARARAELESRAP